MLESQIQSEVIIYCRNKHKDDFFVFSVPNEAIMKAVQYIPQKIRYMIFSKLKQMGFTSGLPDLWFLKNGKIIAIELKNETGRLTESQKKIFPILEKFIDKIEIARSLKDVMDILEKKEFI